MMCKVLIFSCISALMLMTAAYGAHLPTEKVHLLKALITDLKFLEKSKDKIHLDLYTPNEKQECSWRTLQCYLTEIGTLENEIDGDNLYNLQNIKKNLQSLMLTSLLSILGPLYVLSLDDKTVCSKITFDPFCKPYGLKMYFGKLIGSHFANKLRDTTIY